MEFYEITLPIKKKKIEVKDWSFKEDIDLAKKINALDTDEKDYMFKRNNVIIDFVREHVKEQEIIDTINTIDFYYILISITNGSKGNIIKYNFKCLNEDVKVKDKDEVRKCTAYNQFQQTQLDIINDIEYPDIKKVVIQASDELSIELKPIGLVDDMKLLQKMFDNEEYTYIDYKYELLISSIGDIVEKGKPKHFNSIDDKKEYIGNLRPKYLKELQERFKEIVADINITKKNKCPICKNEEKMVITDFGFFL